MTKHSAKLVVSLLASAVIIPSVAVQPAQAEVAKFTFAYYSLTDGNVAFPASTLGSVISATGNTNVSYIATSTNEVIAMRKFSAYFAAYPTATIEEIIAELIKRRHTLTASEVKALKVQEGMVKEGVIDMAPPKPVEPDPPPVRPDPPYVPPVKPSIPAPKVTDMVAVESNRIFVYTDRAITLDKDSVVTVTKGSTLFAKDSIQFDGKLQDVATTAYTDAVVGTYNNRPGFWVVIADEGATLYGVNDSTATVQVTVENYKNQQVKGQKVIKQVLLKKNELPPTIEDAIIEKANNTLVVTFNQSIMRADNSSLPLTHYMDFILMARNGVSTPAISEAVINDKQLIISSATGFTSDLYNLTISANKFKGREDRKNVSTYLINTASNALINREIKNGDGAKLLQLAGITTITPDENGVKIIMALPPQIKLTGATIPLVYLDEQLCSAQYNPLTNSLEINLPNYVVLQKKEHKLEVNGLVDEDGVLYTGEAGTIVMPNHKFSINYPNPTFSEASYVTESAEATQTTFIKVKYNEAVQIIAENTIVDDFTIVTTTASGSIMPKVKSVTFIDGSEDTLLMELDQPVPTEATTIVTTKNHLYGNAAIAIASKKTQFKAIAGESVSITKNEVDLTNLLRKKLADITAELDAYSLKDYHINKSEVEQILQATRTQLATATTLQELSQFYEASKRKLAEVKTDQQLVKEQADLIVDAAFEADEPGQKLPAVPSGYTIAVKTTSEPTSYNENGEVGVVGQSKVVYTLTHSASGVTADTKLITIIITPK